MAFLGWFGIIAGLGFLIAGVFAIFDVIKNRKSPWGSMATWIAIVLFIGMIVLFVMDGAINLQNSLPARVVTALLRMVFPGLL